MKSRDVKKSQENDAYLAKIRLRKHGST